MLFTEEATQQFTDASLKIYNYARAFGMEPWPGAPIFVRHFDITLALNTGIIMDSGNPIEWISRACVALSVNVFMYLNGQLDDDDAGETGRSIRDNPTIVDFRRSMGTVQATHIAVKIESSLDCRLTCLKLRFLVFDTPHFPSSALAA